MMAIGPLFMVPVQGGPGTKPLKILRERLAKGEIHRKEFQERKRLLTE